MRVVAAAAVLLAMRLSAPVAQAQADQVIEDPELGELSTQSVEPAPPLLGLEAEARLLLHSRFGIDLRQSDAREEIWESTTIAGLETLLRRSQSLRFAVGARARYHAASLSAPVTDAGARRFELDATITAANVDLGLTEGAHLRLGYQSVQLGRFDLVSGTDVLSAFDLREGAATLPDAYQLAQLAACLDYAPGSWLALRVLYVPFFTPHLISLVEGDYGLARPNQAAVDRTTSMFGITNQLAAYLSRADRERLARSGLSALAPEPDLASQQAAFRVTVHRAEGELALTAATALEHLPAIHFTEDAIAAIATPATAAARLASLSHPVRVEHGRFAILALDGSLDLAPVSVAFEATYAWHRTLYTLGTGRYYPTTLPLPDTTDLAQLAVKLEYVSESEWLVTLEAFGTYAMREPRDRTRGWLFFEAERYLAGVVLAGFWEPIRGLRVTLGAAALTGPSAFIVPSVAYEVLSGLDLELGAVIVEGPVPPSTATPLIALGSVWGTTDQVFAGLRYSL